MPRARRAATSGATASSTSRSTSAVVHERHRRVGAHAPGVGPAVAVAQALEVLGRGQGGQPAGRRTAPAASTRARPAPPRPPPAGRRRRRRAPDSLASMSASASASESVTSTPLPAARPSVLTTHGPGRVRRKALAAAGSANTPKRAVGTPASASTSFMNALDPSSRAPSAPGPNTRRPAGPQPVGQPVDQRGLGPDDVEVGVDLLGRGGHAGDGVALGGPAGDPGVARGHHHVGGAPEHHGQGVLPPARSDHAHGRMPGRSPGRRRGAAHAAKRTNCSRPGPTPTSRTGVPICSARKCT